MEEQEKRLEVIASSMSTRFVGLFPKNIDAIVHVVGKAVRRLDIMVDFVAYGQYSDHAAFEAYMYKLKQALDKHVDIRMLVYGPKPAQFSHETQFRKANFEDEKTTLKFKNFFEACYPGLPEPSTPEAFEATLITLEDHYRWELQKKGVKMRVVTDAAMMMFMWMEDCEEGVFAFLNIDREYSEISFRTQDGVLLNTFRSMFESSWATAIPVAGWQLPEPVAAGLGPRALASGDAI
jgi:hypothetical protein